MEEPLPKAAREPPDLGPDGSRFHHLIEATGDVIRIVDCVSGQVVYCSASFEHVWGHAVQALLRDPGLWERCIHPDDRVRVRLAWLEWLASRSGRWEAEFRIVRPDGQVRWLRERGVSMTEAETRGTIQMMCVCTDITVQHVTATALHESEERFALAVDGSADGIWDWEIQTGMMYMSERAQALYGIDPSSTTLRPRAEWLELVNEPAPDVVARRLAMERYIAGETGMLDAEWRFRQRDGTDRWRRVRGRCLWDASGKPIRLSGSISDVDARKRAEQALEHSEERYALAMEASQEGHWDWCVETAEFHVSRRMLDIYGLPADAVFSSPQDFLQVFPIHPADKARWEHALQAYMAGNSPRFVVELRIEREGTCRWVRISGVLSRGPNGKIVRWTGSVSDITDRKAHEDALRESEERFALAVAGSNDGIWDWDIATGMQFYSERAQRIYGLTPGQTTRHRSEWRLLVPVHPDDYHDQINAITDYLAGRSQTYEGEWRILLPSGGYKWIRLRGECVRDAAGMPVRLAGSLSDIDAVKREQAARQQSQRLEAVGTLAGGIAHDFNNILGAILGFGEMSLRRTRQGSRTRRDLECIVTAGERGRALVDRILAFSRSSISEQALVHVEKMARESMEMLRPTIPSEVRLECDFRTGTAAIMGDPTQVLQVLGNLVTNAVQSMPDGGLLKVDLGCESLEEARLTTTGLIAAGPYIVLSVSDRGSGIASDDLQRIFDPFFTTKEVNVGTGLGLSLVHGVVTELGGAIDVTSRVGEGSRFVVYLPRSGDVAEPRKSSEQNLPRGNMQRVLVVDDDPALTRLTSELCASLGYQWMSCTSSLEAARVFRNNPDHFDAVLTDERMPGMSGTALIRSLRTVRNDIPIIVMSGYLGDGLDGRALELGASAVLSKPVAREDLAAALSMSLSGQPNGRNKADRRPPAPKRSRAGRQRGGHGSE